MTPQARKNIKEDKKKNQKRIQEGGEGEEKVNQSESKLNEYQ